MSLFTWLHISDFHFTNPLEYSRDILFKQLIKDIELQCADGKKLNAIFFTGDISFSGQQNQYEIAKNTFDELLRACKLEGERDKLFIIPGNHDVNRKKIHPECDFIRKRILEKVEDHYSQVDDFLLDEVVRKRFFYRFNEYENFLHEYYSTTMPTDEASYYYVKKIDHDEKQIAVVGLNSAWMSQEDNEQGRLFLGRVQVNRAIEKLEHDFPGARLKFILTHHPIYWLSEVDLAAIEPKISNSCSIFLHGHLHSPRLNIHGDPDSTIHIMAAGSGFESSAKINAYNIVQLDLDNGKAIASLRFQHPEYSVHWGKDTLTYRNATDGKLEFQIRLW
jgi:predicted phosphodiesterase